MKEITTANIIRLDCDDPCWEEFLAQTRHTIFHTSQWQQVIARAFKAESAIYAYCQESKIRLAIVGFVFNFKICRIFYASLFDGGIVGDRSVMNEFIDFLLAKLRKDRIDKIRILQTYSAPLEAIPAFKKIEASQHFVNLDSIDENMLWKKLYRNRVRNDVLKARSKGVVIKEIKNDEEIKILYKLHRETIKRNRTFSTFNESLLIDFYRYFLRTGLGKGWLAQMDGTYIAGLLTVYSETASHAMVSGSIARYLNCRPNDMLFHEGIVDAIRNKKLYFDFMPSPKDMKKLQLYKSKFGTMEFHACFYEKNLSCVRTVIWDAIWKIMHTSIGGFLLRILRG